MPFNIYPGVDPEDYKFPPLIRQSMALYEELIAAFSGKYLEQDVADHKANKTNPHAVTKVQVGLNNVDNTSDSDKPVSKAQQDALNLKANAASPAFTGTPTGLMKAHVGLSSVDNTSDAAKPVSTAQAALFVPRFKASTDYIAGQQIVNPTNDVVSALSNFTSTESYNAANWTTPASIGSIGKGLIATVNTPGQMSPINTSEQVVDSMSISVIAGRWYEASFVFFSTSSMASLGLKWSLKTSATTDNTVAGTIMDSGGCYTSTVAGGGISHFVNAHWQAANTETLKLKCTLMISYGSGTVTVAKRRLTLTDEGAQF